MESVSAEMVPVEFVPSDFTEVPELTPILMGTLSPMLLVSNNAMRTTIVVQAQLCVLLDLGDP